MESINVFKWMFKQRDFTLEQLAETLDSFTELSRKFLIEGKIDMVSALYK